MARKRLAACAVALVLAAGCGTFNNVTEHDGPVPLGGGTQMPYGGVRMDLCSFGEAYAHGENGQRTGILLVPYFMFIDAPLSFIGDTLTLPYTWYVLYSINHYADGSRVPGPPSESHVLPATASQPASP